VKSMSPFVVSYKDEQFMLKKTYPGDVQVYECIEQCPKSFVRIGDENWRVFESEHCRRSESLYSNWYTLLET
jgi:hypothetical protein